MPNSEFPIGYTVPRWSPSWAITQRDDYRSPHAVGVQLLGSVLEAWLSRAARLAKVARDLPIRWIAQEPKPGLIPDLCLLDPAPHATVRTLCTWHDDQSPPKLVVEFIDGRHPHKQYIDLPDRCAACGVDELWLYDPTLSAHPMHGGPHPLQVWTSSSAGKFERQHAGPGPAYSALLSAWLHPVTDGSPARLHIADDQDSTVFWPTASEQRARELDRTTLELQRVEEQRDALERQVEALSSRLDGKR